MNVNEISTPALIVEKSIFEKNLYRMKELSEKLGLILRPHYKSNKCPYIAKKQIELGSVGVCSAKLGEAIDLAESGIKDILIANEIVEPAKIKVMAELSKKAVLTVLVDSKENAIAIENALEEADSYMRCYIELDTGMHRCGGTVEECIELASYITSALKRLTFGGIQAYAGHLSHEADEEKRHISVKAVVSEVKRLVKALEERGIRVPIVSGISTGTILDKAEFSIYNEAQTGSYIFSDASYNKLNHGFENSLFVLTTVISARPDRIVTDSGVKTCGVDQGPPEVVGLEDYKIELHEEHGLITKSGHNYKVCDRLRYIPGHCCSTINLYDKIYFVDGDEVVDIVPIVSRGKSQ